MGQDTDPVINSALPVYIPGCVRIRASGWDLDDPQLRSYLRLSLYVLLQK